MKTKHEQLLLKKLMETTSVEEDEQFEVWLRQDRRNLRTFEEQRRLWLLRQAEAPDFFPQGIKPVPTQKRKRSKVFFVFEGLALVLMIIATLLIYDGLKDRPSIFPAGKKIISFTLSDSTEVTLKPGGTLLVSSGYGIENRMVELEGEAYFHVKADTLKPFVVLSKSSKVEVIGTSFVLNFDKEAETDEVQVLSGKVRLSSQAGPEQDVIVEPGHKGVLHRANQAIAVQAIDTANLLAWKKKELIFENTPMHEVIEVLENYFGIGIGIENKDLLECRLTRTFKDPSLEEIVEAFKISMDMVVLREYRRIVLKGTGCK